MVTHYTNSISMIRTSCDESGYNKVTKTRNQHNNHVFPSSIPSSYLQIHASNANCDGNLTPPNEFPAQFTDQTQAVIPPAKLPRILPATPAAKTSESRVDLTKPPTHILDRASADRATAVRTPPTSTRACIIHQYLQIRARKTARCTAESLQDSSKQMSRTKLCPCHHPLLQYNRIIYMDQIYSAQTRTRSRIRLNLGN